MTTYTKCGKTKINGLVKIIYKKDGSNKQYVQYKGKHVGLLKYKTIIKNKITNSKKPSTKRHRSMKMGGYFNTEETSWGINDISGSLTGASNDISGSLADASSGASGAVSGASGAASQKIGGKCRKVKKCKKVKSGKNKGKRVCRKACK